MSVKSKTLALAVFFASSTIAQMTYAMNEENKKSPVKNQGVRVKKAVLKSVPPCIKSTKALIQIHENYVKNASVKTLGPEKKPGNNKFSNQNILNETIESKNIISPLSVETTLITPEIKQKRFFGQVRPESEK